MGSACSTQSKGAVGQYHGNLQAAGIDRNAVDVVIISHFHGDHINGLIGPENKPVFPNAEIMVPETEWAFWIDESNVSKLPEVARPQMGNVKRVFGIAQQGDEISSGQGNCSRNYRDRQPRPHTWPHFSFLASGNSKVLIQADITAGAATLFARNPDWQFVFDTDKAQAVETRKKLYDMAATEKMMVQGYHIAFPSLVYVERSGSGFRLVPAPLEPVDLAAQTGNRLKRPPRGGLLFCRAGRCSRAALSCWRPDQIQ